MMGMDELCQETTGKDPQNQVRSILRRFQQDPIQLNYKAAFLFRMIQLAQAEWTERFITNNMVLSGEPV